MSEKELSMKTFASLHKTYINFKYIISIFEDKFVVNQIPLFKNKNFRMDGILSPSNQLFWKLEDFTKKEIPSFNTDDIKNFQEFCIYNIRKIFKVFKALKKNV